MKLFLFISIFLINNYAYCQEFTYENLKNQIGNKISDFDDFYNIKSDSIIENFDDLKFIYKDINKDNSIFNIIIETINKNIVNIIVKNQKNKTFFF